MYARNHMEDMGFSSWTADSDIWPRPKLKYNGVEHYQHVLLCTDQVWAIFEEPERFLREELEKQFT